MQRVVGRGSCSRHVPRPSPVNVPTIRVVQCHRSASFPHPLCYRGAFHIFVFIRSVVFFNFDIDRRTLMFSICRRFGPKCSGCGQGISPQDLVRKARDKVFHLKCFTCFVCRKQLLTGEELYVVDDTKFVCKEDYNHRLNGEEILHFFNCECLCSKLKNSKSCHTKEILFQM